MRCIDREQFNAEKDVPSMGVRTNLSRKGKCSKKPVVYLIYQTQYMGENGAGKRKRDQKKYNDTNSKQRKH